MGTMKQLVNDVASAGCRNTCGQPHGSGNNSIIIIAIILLICTSGGAGNVLGSYGRRRGRRRRPGLSLIWLGIIALLLSGNNNGRNANTNIINVDTAALEETGGGLLDL